MNYNDTIENDEELISWMNITRNLVQISPRASIIALETHGKQSSHVSSSMDEKDSIRMARMALDYCSNKELDANVSEQVSLFIEELASMHDGVQLELLDSLESMSSPAPFIESLPKIFYLASKDILWSLYSKLLVICRSKPANILPCLKVMDELKAPQIQRDKLSDLALRHLESIGSHELPTLIHLLFSFSNKSVPHSFRILSILKQVLAVLI